MKRIGLSLALLLTLTPSLAAAMPGSVPTVPSQWPEQGVFCPAGGGHLICTGPAVTRGK